MVNLKLVIQTDTLVDASGINLSDCTGNINFKLTNLNHQVIETKIQLPNIVYITTFKENIILKELWLGNIKASDSMLNQICYYTTDNSSIYTTNWHSPGSISIEFFDSSFIEFHLHYNNNLIINS